MENNSRMIGLKQEDQEIELDLGLSIEGGFKKSEKPNPVQVKHEPVHLQRTSDLKASSFGTDLRGSTKRQDHKQQNEGMCINGGFDDVVQENKMWLKSPKLERNEPEVDVKERECKRSRVESNGFGNNNMEMKDVNLNFTIEQNLSMNQDVAFGSNNPTLCSTSTVCPVIYPYLPVQFFQFPNGLPYPYVNVVPFWANGGVSVGNEQNVVQSLVNQSFKPFPTGHESGYNVGNGCASDQNSRKQESTNVSPVCSSSVASDLRSSSHEGGGSSDTRSHSIHSLPEHPHSLRNSKGNGTKGQSEHSASSHSRETAQIHDETTDCIKPTTTTSNHAQRSPATSFTNSYIKQKIPSNSVQFCPIKPKEKAAITPPIYENPVLTTENPSPASLKESKRGIGKPPKPQTHNQNVVSLPHMPCVSTTGNGPNAKTINGFLYKYSKTEVSIVCVCHGTSFSPAEFVRHAGGIDVSNPLRHITVIPSGF